MPPAHPGFFLSLRRVIAWLLLIVIGAALGLAGVHAWRHELFSGWNWTAILAIAILANSVIALLPIWRDERRRRRQAELVRFRLWIHFSKLRWLLTHLNEQEPGRTLFSPGCGGEELYGIEVLLAQAQTLDVDEYEWVIFTVNAALPYFGRPIRDLDSHAVRLLWTVDATLAKLSKRPSSREPAPGQ